MIDTLKYKLAKKRLRYGLYVYAMVAVLVVFNLFLSYVNPEKYPYNLVMIFMPVCLTVLGWSMRLSGRHEMNEEREAHA